MLGLLQITFYKNNNKKKKKNISHIFESYYQEAALTCIVIFTMIRKY